MVDLCDLICEDIEEHFGHIVDPNKLTELIENSPLKEVEDDTIY